MNPLSSIGLRAHKRIPSRTYRRRLKSRLGSLRLIVHLRGRDAGNNTFMNPYADDTERHVILNPSFPQGMLREESHRSTMRHSVREWSSVQHDNDLQCAHCVTPVIRKGLTLAI